MTQITAYEPKTQTFIQIESDDFFAATFSRNEEGNELAQRLGALDRFMTDHDFRLSADLRKEFKLAYVTKGEKAANVEELIAAVIAEIATEFPAEDLEIAEGERVMAEFEALNAPRNTKEIERTAGLHSYMSRGNVIENEDDNKMTIEEFRALTINQAIECLGVKPSRDTYIYLNEKMELDCIEKSDRHSDPEDEFMSMGYVSVHLR